MTLLEHRLKIGMISFLFYVMSSAIVLLLSSSWHERTLSPEGVVCLVDRQFRGLGTLARGGGGWLRLGSEGGRG